MPLVMPVTKMLTPILCASLLLTGVTACQPNKEGSISNNEPTVERLTPSAEAQAIVQDFKAEFVTRALEQQENQLAASNAMLVADNPKNSSDNTENDEGDASSINEESDSSEDSDENNQNSENVSNVGSAINIGQSEPVQDDEAQADDPPQDDLSDEDRDTQASDSDNVSNDNVSNDNASDDNSENNDNESSGSNETDTTSSSSDDDKTEEKTEVQKKAQEEIEAEREAKIEPLPIDELNDPEKHPLPLATIIIPPPEELTAEQLEARYHQAMQDLYLPDDVLLPPQSADTLLSVATLIPDLFKNPELARRLTLKSPAMARLLRQYQVWEQIEAQQSIELAELKVAQREAQEAQKKKFEELMAEFNKTIQGYDKQIAKYEKLLKEYE